MQRRGVADRRARHLHAARGLLVNIAASEETLKLRETKLVMNVICAQTSDDAIIKFGAVFDDTLGDAMRVTVVATGLTRPLEVPAKAAHSPLSRSAPPPAPSRRMTLPPRQARRLRLRAKRRLPPSSQ